MRGIGDIITDFNQGEGDKISLFYIDQQINLKGHGASFQTVPFTLIWSQSGADTLVQMDFDGDRTADWEILLENFTSSSLVASDFILPPEKMSSSALVGTSIQPMARALDLLVLRRLTVAILVPPTRIFRGHW